MTAPAGACDSCGSTVDVDRYLSGRKCPPCSPAGLAGRTVPRPVPLEPSPPREPREYGTATSDPLGRTVPGTSRTGYIPKRPE